MSDNKGSVSFGFGAAQQLLPQHGSWAGQIAGMKCPGRLHRSVGFGD